MSDISWDLGQQFGTAQLNNYANKMHRITRRGWRKQDAQRRRLDGGLVVEIELDGGEGLNVRWRRRTRRQMAEKDSTSDG
ncbi:hypothetical protein Dsin_001734 [Dipteronia sinensis]|uniref:Uncharacterized protein n=1 Tax=Dipteronia sinensis TaxID=43782 RepID=A0AAE0EIL9_9ROSI|nr:hypothetical protein Dsin_001734 [Dipteronia sinensis]